MSDTKVKHVTHPFPPLYDKDSKILILKNNLALWDVIAECEIVGSSDASLYPDRLFR